MPDKRIVRYHDHISDKDKPSWSKLLHPVLQRIYSHRNITNQKELDKSFQHLEPFSTLKDIDKACSLLEYALRHEERIVVVGDFDADGATSTAVAVKALQMLGAKHVNFLVPNRFKYGYGLTPEIVRDAHDLKAQLIITVDNGISSVDGVDEAKRLGIKVLITDHHLPSAETPKADAIVNPNQLGDEFPAKSTAGVGVIFYVMLALRSQLRKSDWFISNSHKEPNLAALLDIVALGTVADVVPLSHNNRILVDQGLKRIRAGHACPGIKALIEISKRSHHKLTAGDLGFALGPRLNAAGRMEDMRIGIHCLLSEDINQAREIATQLDMLNQERRKIEGEMQEQAMQILDHLHLTESETLPLGICIFDAGWHQGVIGILASRIKERFHRPVIAFAHNTDLEIKGSARSIPGVHIRDILDNISARYPHLISKFGGHAMAAGLSLPIENFEEFSLRFDEEIRRAIREDQLEGIIHSDGELDSNDLSFELANLLQEAGPWGQNFPEPVFDGVFQIHQQRIVGDKHLKLVLQHTQANHCVDAIAFNVIEKKGDTPAVTEGDQVKIAYKLDINEFRGQSTLQLMVEHLQKI